MPRHQIQLITNLDQLPKALQEATPAELATSLSDATDKLNEKLKEAEEALVALNLGVRASVALNESEYVSFHRANQTWGLFFEAGPPDSKDGKDWSSTPLTNASRATRLAAAAMLPELKQKLVDVAKHQIVSVAQTIDYLNEFIRDVRRTP
jgi:hypothetical protein